MTCPSCNGTRKVQLLTSTVVCLDCPPIHEPCAWFAMYPEAPGVARTPGSIMSTVQGESVMDAVIHVVESKHVTEIHVYDQAVGGRRLLKVTSNYLVEPGDVIHFRARTERI